MSSSGVLLPPVTIPNGTAVSQWVRASNVYGSAISLTLYGPAALDGGHVYIIETTHNPDAAVPVVQTFKRGDPLVSASPPGVSEAVTYYDLPGVIAFRIKDSTGNVGATRTWQLSEQTESR